MVNPPMKGVVLRSRIEASISEIETEIEALIPEIESSEATLSVGTCCVVGPLRPVGCQKPDLKENRPLFTLLVPCNLIESKAEKRKG